MQRLRNFLFACVCTEFATSIAAAVTALPPPEPNLRKTPPAWMGFGLMFLFFGVVVAISLMTSKRGHQD